MTRHSRVLISAPASGSGKTTVATGLMAALRRRGTTVAAFKVGPDYIDPGYHALATGRPGRNLDPVLVGAQRIAPLAAHGATAAQVAVVEGVMGLFDGRAGTAGHGSTAHVAALLAAPVLLVVDVRGQGRSLAALLHGFRSFDASVWIAGVVLNQVGSARHEQTCRDACAEVGLPVLGALRRDDALAVPSRHLGLVTAAEHAAAAGVVARWADAVAAQVDLDAVLSLAAPAPSTPRWEAEAEVTRTAGEPVVAMAGGPAFTFGYAEHADLLAAAGATIAVFDPLRDESLPPGAAGMVLPGGFPECHTEELSANVALRAEIHALVRCGAPVHAECGGLLYLCRSVDGAPMCGVLDAQASMTGQLVLGYRDAVALRGSVLHREGDRVSGHEFHRTTVTPRAGEPAWGWRGAPPEGFVKGGVHASFLHTHPAAHPAAVARFVASCAKGTP
ncbi:MAG: cobyrinate a,c-diamide synthase [Pseudonocardiales bacterium]|nr:cobyrinate a,c-diamide synthase [Pseudonocardiales bacterium]MBV9649907.1 cobyrinate a,c-diamide synthase [Pseudonocardiales bacterium]